MAAGIQSAVDGHTWIESGEANPDAEQRQSRSTYIIKSKWFLYKLFKVPTKKN